MGRCGWLTLAVAVNGILAAVSQAQPNSCISSTDGFWDESRLWSLATPPSIAQSAVLITNDVAETITIDSITASNFPSTLTISNLTISTLSGIPDTLFLNNTGPIALHILESLTVGISINQFGSSSPTHGGQLIASNSTVIVDGLLGGQFQNYGTMVINGGSLITTNCTLQVAGPDGFAIQAIGLLVISNGVVSARDVAIAGGELSVGTIEVIGGTMTLASSLKVGGDQSSHGNLLVANGSLFVVTNGQTSVGSPNLGSGAVTISNAIFLAADVILGGFQSGGGLAINNGTVTLSGQLALGIGAQCGGSVDLNGGLLVVTNNPTTIAGQQCNGVLTVENGLFLAREILVGTENLSVGMLKINGGTTRLNSYLQIGRLGPPTASGVIVNGGQLVVTNDVISLLGGGTIVVSNGSLVANQINLSIGNFGQNVLSINGGSVTALTGITLGDCASNVSGQVFVSGGQLIVTNVAHTGFIDVRNGQLVLSNGLLRVDKLVMTNGCSSFTHTGGTLIAGSVVLDPNAFRITSVAREGNNLRVTWLMAPGQTNTLQVSSGGIRGAYITNSFTDIFTVMNNTTAGTLTNYLDIGAATNKLSRFYRARLAP